MREFEDRPAIREMTPLLIGLAGPSGSGKTASALRLATGIQRVAGGQIWGIDSEANRMLHYAPKEGEQPDPAQLIFKFQHLKFNAPFGPLDYLAAIRHCANKGAAIIIVDSFSHEHEGPGGVLEMHGAELERLSRSDDSKRDRYNMLAWQKPKAQRRQLINAILQMPINFIFCFRAKEKIKPGKVDGKSEMVQLGWMPIAGEEYVYEATISCLLEPGSDGNPTWDVGKLTPAQKIMLKLPKQFKKLFDKEKQLCESMGEAMALWASGGKRLPSDWHAEQAKERQQVSERQSASKPQVESGPDASVPCPMCITNAPRCKACKIEMLFQPSGIARDERVYPGFWRCPRKCKDPDDKRRNTNMKALDWHAILIAEKPVTPPMRKPGDDSYTLPEA